MLLSRTASSVAAAASASTGSHFQPAVTLTLTLNNWNRDHTIIRTYATSKCTRPQTNAHQTSALAATSHHHPSFQQRRTLSTNSTDHTINAHTNGMSISEELSFISLKGDDVGSSISASASSSHSSPSSSSPPNHPSQADIQSTIPIIQQSNRTIKSRTKPTQKKQRSRIHYTPPPFTRIVIDPSQAESSSSASLPPIDEITPRPPPVLHSRIDDIAASIRLDHPQLKPDVKYGEWRALIGDSVRCYFIGDDGSVYNANTKKFLFSRSTYYLQVDPNQSGIDVSRKFISCTEIILTTHGHPRPSPTSFIHFIDGDKTNFALSNLSWCERLDWSAHPKLVSERIAAYERGELIHFSPVEDYSSIIMCSDGRIWSIDNDDWMTSQSEGFIHLQLGNHFQHLRVRQDLVWSAFKGRPVSEGMVIGFIDGNDKNCRIENLHEINPRPIQTGFAPDDWPPSRPPPLPKPILQSQPPSHLIHPPPFGADPNAKYARFPIEPFTHYIVGTDGSIRNLTLRSYEWYHGVVDHGTIYCKFCFSPSDQEKDKVTLSPPPPLGEAVLVSHGHPKPAPNAVIRYRDGNKLNNHLTNLNWETTEEVLENEIKLAFNRDEPLRFATHPSYPSYRIGQDGRVWSTLSHSWLAVYHHPNGAVVHGLRHISGQHRSISTHILMWETFVGPILPRHKVLFLDGNRKNYRLDNLQLRPPATKKNKTKSSKPKLQSNKLSSREKIVVAEASDSSANSNSAQL